MSATHAQIEERVKACAECHGADGNSVKAGVPSIAGQPKVFLENYLVMTREGIRGSYEMQGLLKGLPDREIAALAVHYSQLLPQPVESRADNELFDQGRQVAAKSHCGSCHLSNFRGQEQMPRLAGQREDFLAETMLAYRHNRRPGADTMMSAALYGIAEADFKALAHYFSRLK